MNTGTSRARPGAEIRVHLLEVAVALPQRIGRFDQGRAELAAEHRLDLGRGGGRDRLGRLLAGAHQHRLADDADAHALQRAASAPWRGAHSRVASTDERGTVV